MQNAFCESFNGRTRDELLNGTLFLGLRHASAKLASWASDYNTKRPRSGLGYLTSAAQAALPNRNRRSAAQPRPAPPIARCSIRARRRINQTGSNRG